MSTLKFLGDPCPHLGYTPASFDQSLARVKKFEGHVPPRLCCYLTISRDVYS